MLIIESTDKLQLVTSAAGDIDVHVDYVRKTAETSTTPDKQVSTITTATTTDIKGVATDVETVKSISIANVHASVSNVVEVLYHDGTNARRLAKCTLLPGESLRRDDRGLWAHYDAEERIYAVAGGGVDPRTNDFRLSGVSATPVMTADSTSLSTIYLAEYKGRRLALYDGTNWQLAAPSAEVSLAVTGRTTDLPFDIFAFLNAGVVTLEFLDWTNATTRATGLTRQDGVWTKSGDPTRRYLGSCRARSATTFHHRMNGDDVPVRLDLWNADNRVEFAFTLRALTNTWTYTVATWRQAQASANYQVEIMVGLQECWFEATLMTTSRNSTISIPRQCGIGFDSTTAFTGTTASDANTVASIESNQVARIKHMPAIGRHFYSWNEISTATGTCTWVGDDGALRIQSGMTGNFDA
jgi:hypothetical protein